MPTQFPQFIHHGAKDGVTGSCHQLLLDEHTSLLVDCGLFQGAELSPDQQASAQQLAINFAIASVQALIVTHVHIDHVGRIPYLLAAGYQGPIICSEPSAKLLPLVLEDAFKLGVSRDQTTVEQYLKLIEKRIIALPYNRWLPMLKRDDLQVKIRLQRAGHILGSAYVELDIHYPKTQNKQRVIFSGDLGAPYAPILTAPKPAYRADTVVIESTYGDRLHDSRKNRRQRLQTVIEQALTDGGTVLIPAFSIGRTQELLYELEDIIYRSKQPPHPLMASQPPSLSQSQCPTRWAQLPIILDSPLASRFSETYRQLQPFWDQEAQQRLKAGRRPLAFEQLISIDSHHDHLQMVQHLQQTKRPAIVIAASGMCSGGRIVDYLKAMLGSPEHNVLFVGYQAEGTLGRQIQQYGPKQGYVTIDQQRIEIKAGIETLGGYSAHADQAGLVRFITGMRIWPSTIRLVHGTPEAKQVLKKTLLAAYSDKNRFIRIIDGSD